MGLGLHLELLIVSTAPEGFPTTVGCLGLMKHITWSAKQGGVQWFGPGLVTGVTDCSQILACWEASGGYVRLRVAPRIAL